MNRYDEAKAVAQSAVAQKVDAIGVHFVLFAIATIQGDQAAMQREISWANGKPLETFFVIRDAIYQGSLGKIRQSRQTGQRAIDLGKKFDFPESATTIVGSQALQDALVGFTESARQKAAAVLHLPGDTSPRASAAETLAEIGDAAQSQKLIDQLNKEFPSDTLVQTCIIPNVKALNLMHHNKPADAVAALEAGRKFELGDNGSFCAYVVLYARGRAYLQLHDGAKAAAEFQKILDHRGIDPISSYYSLAQLQIARAYTLQHDNAKARTAYQDFFALWKDADPDVPVLLAAKSEYAKLP